MKNATQLTVSTFSPAEMVEFDAQNVQPELDAAFDAWLDAKESESEDDASYGAWSDGQDAAYLEWRERENEFAALDDEEDADLNDRAEEIFGSLSLPE